MGPTEDAAGAPGVEANLVETFWSIQGEGTEVGRPSVFVRFGRCDLRCAWCDSVETWRPALRYRVECTPGGGDFEERPNPVPVADAIADVLRLRASASELCSITGGEPLLQPEAVGALARGLRDEGSRILLETHGLAVDAFRAVAGAIDVVSMDWKLASDVRRESDPRHGDVADFHEVHEAFLRRALDGVADGGRVYVKIVVTPSTRDEELREAASRIARVSRDLPLVLQPVTPSGPVRQAPDAGRMLACVRRCADHLADVRMIPQTHKLLGLL